MAMGEHPATYPQDTRLKITEFDKRVKPCEEVGLIPDHDMKGVIVRTVIDAETREHVAIFGSESYEMLRQRVPAFTCCVATPSGKANDNAMVVNKTPLVPAQAYALTQPSYASVAATSQNDEDWPDHVYDEHSMVGN
jgi:hypothetical protein